MLTCLSIKAWRDLLELLVLGRSKYLCTAGVCSASTGSEKQISPRA
jgi:hypothetical protein